MTDFDKVMLDAEVTMFLLNRAPEYVETTLHHEGPRSYSKNVLSAKKRARLYLAARAAILAEKQFEIARDSQDE